MKLDYIFAPLLLVFFALLCAVGGTITDFIFYKYIFLDIFVGLTPFHLNKKYRKWTLIFCLKFEYFPTKSKTFFYDS